LSAAPDTATVTGSVIDASGAVVSWASVSLHQVGGAALLTMACDATGRFSFTNLAAGEYLLDSSAPGLSISQPETISVTARETKQIAVHLVVSAVRTQVSVTAAGAPQSLDEISKALDVVNVADVERRGIFSVSDSIRFLPGLRVSTRGGPGTFTSIQVRGLLVDSTAVLIDGFPFRDPTSIQDEASAYISDLLLVDSSRIEVLRGSGSSLYGTNAMSGTVNIITDSGGGPIHGDIDIQGGGLGLFRGVARLGGGAFKNRLTYSAGVSHLNVTEGVDDAGAVRDWSGQGGVLYALRPNMRLGASVFANTGYLQQNVSPQGLFVAIPASGIIPAIPQTTFIPSLGDPDSGRRSHFVNSLFRFEHEVNSRFSYRIGYGLFDADRISTDGPAGQGFFQPAFNTSQRFRGRIDTLRAQANYILGSHQILSAGYEFQNENYLTVSNDENPDPTQRAYYRTNANQRSSAAFAQDQIRLLNDRLQILLSGRYTQATLSQPSFTGSISPYAGIALPSPPAAYTGDASVAYFLPNTSTKFRAHTGNSFRLPSLYERFGTSLFDGFLSTYGNPGLSPERAVSVDFGFDQYLFKEHLKVSSSYFYSRLQQVIGFLSFPPGYLDPYGRTAGYYNTGGGMARGVELSGEFRPARGTSVSASYTYTNSRDRTSQYFTGTDVAPLQSPRILPHSVTVVATQQFGKHVDLAMDFQGGSNYLYPLYGYAYLLDGPRQLGLAAGYSIHVSDRASVRFYCRVSNTLDQNFYEDGFRTPQRWAVGGIRFTF
jgi:vitamin B12 transporter